MKEITGPQNEEITFVSLNEDHFSRKDSNNQ